MIARAHRSHSRASIFLISKYWSFLHIAYLLWHGYHMRRWCSVCFFLYSLLFWCEAFSCALNKMWPSTQVHTAHTLTLISGRAKQVNFQLLKNTWRFRQDNINYNSNIVIRTQSVYWSWNNYIRRAVRQYVYIVIHPICRHFILNASQQFSDMYACIAGMPANGGGRNDGCGRQWRNIFYKMYSKDEKYRDWNFSKEFFF